MQYIIKPWQRDEATALQIYATLKKAVPTASLPPLERAFSFFESLSRKYPHLFLLVQDVMHPELLIGTAFMMIGPEKNSSRLIGGIIPEYQRRGIGEALLNHFMRTDYYPEITTFHARCFQSLPSGANFLERHGFSLREIVYDFSLDLNASLSPALSTRVNHVLDQYQILSRAEYMALKPQGQHALWALETSTQQDIPTVLGVVTLPFEEWLESQSFSPPELTLVALNQDEPVGIIKMSKPQGEVINIGYTGVAASHRRRGVSLALKVTALRLAKAWGAQTLTTQNHAQNRAILATNREFGFQERDVFRDYSRDRSFSRFESSF